MELIMEQTMEITELDQDETQRLFELYQEECKHQGVQGNLKDFLVWVEER